MFIKLLKCNLIEIFTIIKTIKSDKKTDQHFISIHFVIYFQVRRKSYIGYFR